MKSLISIDLCTDTQLLAQIRQQCQGKTEYIKKILPQEYIECYCSHTGSESHPEFFEEVLD